MCIRDRHQLPSIRSVMADWQADGKLLPELSVPTAYHKVHRQPALCRRAVHPMGRWHVPTSPRLHEWRPVSYTHLDVYKRQRWTRMTLKDFFKRRLVRLHPMVIMGTLIGALLFYFGDCSAFPFISETPWWKLLLLFLLSCTMIPAVTSWDIRGWEETNPLNRCV